MMPVYAGKSRQKRPWPLALILAVTVWLAACATSPLGRTQLNLFPETQMEQMGITAYQEMKQKLPQSTDSRVNNYVRCVADAITREVGGPSGAQSWEVTVFDNENANAFALPGGKIGVYTGMLKVARNQDQLAAVIAHEVAHVLSRHANERASAKLATQTGLDMAQVITGTPSTTKSVLLGALGLGAQVGILLPYDRTQEKEADLYGLDLMSRAGFDPRESIPLWHNMSEAGKGQPPEFLSTHPSHQTRIQELNTRMPRAMSLYEKARSGGKRPYCRVP